MHNDDSPTWSWSEEGRRKSSLDNEGVQRLEKFARQPTRTIRTVKMMKDR